VHKINKSTKVRLLLRIHAIFRGEKCIFSAKIKKKVHESIAVSKNISIFALAKQKWVSPIRPAPDESSRA